VSRVPLQGETQGQAHGTRFETHGRRRYNQWILREFLIIGGLLGLMLSVWMRCATNTATNNGTGRCLPAFSRHANTPTACTLGTAQCTQATSRLPTLPANSTHTRFFSMQQRCSSQFSQNPTLRLLFKVKQFSPVPTFTESVQICNGTALLLRGEKLA
jgi:hypothetical protein